MTIKVTAEGRDGAALEAEANEAIDAFDDWFQEELQNAPMTPSEVAAVKTFLWWAIHRDRGNVRPTVSPPRRPPP